MSRRLFVSALMSCLLQACDGGATGGAKSGGSPSTIGGQSAMTGGTLAATGGTSTATGGSPAPTSRNPTATGGTATGGTSGPNGGTSGAAAGAATTGGTTGGVPATAGALTTGGSIPAGGAIATGRTGGATATVGTAATGGANTGGTSAAGGTTATGGTMVGGTTATAGSRTGGAIAMAGMSGTGGNPAPTNPGPPETKPLGYGQATTGGGSATAVEASTMAAVQAAIAGYAGAGGLVIRYTGTFNFASISDPCAQWNLPAQIVEIKQKSNITIQGADGSAANFGLHIASSSSNIIIRNMTFGLLPGGDASDVISIEGMSSGIPKDIWVDHNELFSSMATCSGAGDSSFDGLIDAKKGADNITVSYNYLHDHHKASLNGFTDDDSAVRHITYHHNVFENIGSRTPLQRNGYSHVFNNHFNQITASGINVRMDGYSLIESNYFENAKNPVTSRDSSAIGYWDLRNNNITSPADFTKFAITWSASSSTPTKDATDWTTTKAFPVALGYSYQPDPVQCAKDGLRSVVGAGKGLATLKCN